MSAVLFTSGRGLQGFGLQVFGFQFLALCVLCLTASSSQLFAQGAAGELVAASFERGSGGLALTVAPRSVAEPLAASRLAVVGALDARERPALAPIQTQPSSTSGQVRSRGLPWVTTMEWRVPEEYGADVFKGQRTEFKPWSVFGEELLAARTAGDPPSHVGLQAPDSFVVFEPQRSDFSRQFRKLIRAKLYREVRHRAKREWKSLYLSHPSMRFADYESQLFQINNLGKNREDRDDFSLRATATETKQDFLGRRRADGEADIPLVSWGPFTVKDTGALRFDVGRAALGAEYGDDDDLEVGTETHVPILATVDYEVETSFNVDFDPLRGSVVADPRSAVRQFGMNVEVRWLSAVLGRELVTTEVDLETDLYGDFKGFFNIVIKSR